MPLVALLTTDCLTSLRRSLGRCADSYGGCGKTDLTQVQTVAFGLSGSNSSSVPKILGVFGDAEYYQTLCGVTVNGDSRRRRDASVALRVPTVSNPLVCVRLNDAVTFALNPQQRLSFPVYQKDHLLNSNPTFDYGAFRNLEELLTTTNLSLSLFTHQFTEAGIYVFNDNLDAGLLLFLRVMADGVTCPASALEPARASSLILAGATTSTVHEEPDWTLIAVVLGVCAGAVFILVLAVLLWRPKHWAARKQKLAPSYQSLADGTNPFSPRLSEGGDDRLEEIAGQGAPHASAVAASDGTVLLENFNVRTLLDKLEDQTMLVTSELHRHNTGVHKLVCHRTAPARLVLSCKPSRGRFSRLASCLACRRRLLLLPPPPNFFLPDFAAKPSCSHAPRASPRHRVTASTPTSDVVTFIRWKTSKCRQTI